MSPAHIPLKPPPIGNIDSVWPVNVHVSLDPARHTCFIPVFKYGNDRNFLFFEKQFAWKNSSHKKQKLTNRYGADFSQCADLVNITR